LPEPVRLGGTCRPRLVFGIGFMCAITVGRIKASGPTSWQRFLTIPTLAIWWWMAALFGFISMAQQKKQQQEQAMGKSRGGLSTKIHAAVDAQGNPLRLLLTAGQTSEYAQAVALIAGFEANYVLADKGYDSDAFVATITESQAIPVIPSKMNRKVPRDFDRMLYKERNRVERFFQKLKHFRRIATRYERLARNYQAMLSLVSTVIWLN
jgi:transposase